MTILITLLMAALTVACYLKTAARKSQLGQSVDRGFFDKSGEESRPESVMAKGQAGAFLWS